MVVTSVYIQESSAEESRQVVMRHIEQLMPHKIGCFGLIWPDFDPIWLEGWNDWHHVSGTLNIPRPKI